LKLALRKGGQVAYKEMNANDKIDYTNPNWEINLRRHLEETVPEGFYDISSWGHTTFTGKGGKIESIIAFYKMVERMDAAPKHPEPTGKGLWQHLNNNTATYEVITYKNLKKQMRALYYGKK